MESEDSPPRSELVLNRDILSTPIKKVKKEVKKFEGTKIIDSPKESYEFPYLDTKPSVVSPKSTEKNMESEDSPPRSELVEESKLNSEFSEPIIEFERSKIIHSEKSEVIESIPKETITLTANLGKEQKEESQLISADSSKLTKKIISENLPSSKNQLELEFANLKDHEHRKLYNVTEVYLKKSARKIELSFILKEEIPLDYNLGESFISSKFENETYQPLENTVFYDDSFAELCNKTLKLFFENEIDIDLKELKNIETDIHSYQTKLQNNLMSKNNLVEKFLILLSIELKSITRILQNITNVVNKKISENKSDTKEVIIEKENDSLLIQLREKIIKLHEDIIQFDQFYQLN